MNPNYRIMVTGSQGFIGRNLHDKYGDDKQWFFFGRRECNLTDMVSTMRLINIYKPTHIIHLAGMASARKGDSSFIQNNITATYNLLEACLPETHFIFASSILVYGSSSSCMYETDKCCPNSHYAISKLTCENLIKLYFKQGKIRPRVLRLCGIVGKHLTHGRIYDIMSGKLEVNLFGKAPGNYLPYITTEQAMDAIVRCIDYEKPKLLANICPNNDAISTQGVIELLGKALLTPIKMNWDNANIKDEYIYAADDVMKYELGMKSLPPSSDNITNGLKLI